ncbi:MAG: chemotaxis protein CheW [candidate division WOR-3 bacterium]|nr:chemotaxis protein CheW [candidate division WOR-3 bacterium]
MKKKISLDSIIKKKGDKKENKKKKDKKQTSRQQEARKTQSRKNAESAKSRKNKAKGRKKDAPAGKPKQDRSDADSSVNLKPVKQKEEEFIISTDSDIEQMEETKEFVGFRLGNEEFGIDSDYVKQIIKYKKPIDMGINSDIIIGVINTKDGVLPVVDLRQRMNLPSDEFANGSIIIIEYSSIRIGIYVNYLLGIVRIEKERIRPVPPFLPEKQMNYIIGAGLKDDDRIISILDHNSLFSEEDMMEIRSVPEKYK